MTTHFSQSFSRVLPVAAAALFIHMGSATAATPQGDIQQQMRDVLTGRIAAQAIPHSAPDPTSAVRSNADAQEFVRQLLRGWSVSHAEGARAMEQKLQASASASSQKSQADDDFQSTVRQSLLGDRASSRGAL